MGSDTGSLKKEEFGEPVLTPKKTPPRPAITDNQSDSPYKLTEIILE